MNRTERTVFICMMLGLLWAGITYAQPAQPRFKVAVFTQSNGRLEPWLESTFPRPYRLVTAIPLGDTMLTFIAQAE